MMGRSKYYKALVIPSSTARIQEMHITIGHIIVELLKMELELTKTIKTTWHDFHTIIFDFDGVFTNNLVYVGEDMKEFVHVIEDGLRIKMLKITKK